MKMNAVKETKIAGFIGIELHSEHGNVELMFNTWVDGTPKDLAGGEINFIGDIFSVSKSFDNNDTWVNIRDWMHNVADGYYFLEYSAEGLANEMCERSELLQLFGSVCAYLAQF